MTDLVAALREPDPVRRRRLIAVLPHAGKPSPALADALFSLLGDDDPGVRRETAELVGRSAASPAVVEVLDRAIRDEALARRAAAVEAFGRLGPAGVPSLKTLLHEENEGLRRLAVDALGLTAASAATESVGLALNDRSPAVRAAAVEALCRVDPKGAAVRVRTLLRRTDEAPSVLLSALLSLEGLDATVDADELRPHADDAMTAVPALRLLGRAAAASDIVARLGRHGGSRLKAALAGFVTAFQLEPGQAARALLSKRVPTEKIAALLEGGDATSVEGALLVGALLGDATWFQRVARRDDRSHCISQAHHAAHHLRVADPAAELEKLADALDADEPLAAAFLRELATGVAARRERPKPPAPPSLATPKLSGEAFDALRQRFEDSAGLGFDRQAAYRLESRLLPLLKRAGAVSFEAYAALLDPDHKGGAEELRRAIERVTVHETYFFREGHQLEAFKGEVVPALLADGDEPVRVWSAGCSTGEEAWTLAILLEETGAFQADRTYDVVGTDIAPDVVEVATIGRYGRRGFRGEMPGALRERYFDRKDDDEYVVKPALRERVHFEVKNLVDDTGLSDLGQFDVIFCRNVLIYLTKAARARVIQGFYDRLKPGGVLLLGHSESLLSLETEFRFAALSRELVYVKPSGGDDPTRGERLLAKRGAR